MRSTRVAHQLGGERGLLGHRQVGGAGGDDDDRAAAARRRSRPRQMRQARVRDVRQLRASPRVTVRPTSASRRVISTLWRAVAQRARDGDDLLRRLAGAEAPPRARRCAARDGGRPWRSRDPRTADA